MALPEDNRGIWMQIWVLPIKILHLGDTAVLFSWLPNHNRQLEHVLLIHSSLMFSGLKCSPHRSDPVPNKPGSSRVMSTLYYQDPVLRVT